MIWQTKLSWVELQRGFLPDLETIVLNDEEELKVSNELKIDGGYL